MKNQEKKTPLIATTLPPKLLPCEFTHSFIEIPAQIKVIRQAYTPPPAMTLALYVIEMKYY